MEAVAEEAGRGARILLVEDDDEIVDVLRRTLRAEGFTVEAVTTGQGAIDSVEDFLPDIVILDLGLPDIDGEEVCRRLRESQETSRLPILMLTARSEVEDRVSGLDSGADDYLTKPFERVELLARVRALLRRTPPRGSDVLVVGNLRLLPDAREVERNGRSIDLTKTEFELLEYLMRNERLVVSREMLLEEVWGYDLSSGDTNTLDVFISTLRRKLEQDGEPRILHTKRGSGYMLKA